MLLVPLWYVGCENFDKELKEERSYNVECTGIKFLCNMILNKGFSILLVMLH